MEEDDGFVSQRPCSNNFLCLFQSLLVKHNNLHLLMRCFLKQTLKTIILSRLNEFRMICSDPLLDLACLECASDVDYFNYFIVRLDLINLPNEW
jgi:hypothetical protein